MSQVKSSFSTVRDKSQTEDDAQLPEATEGLANELTSIAKTIGDLDEEMASQMR